MKQMWIGVTMIVLLVAITGCSNNENPEAIFKSYLSSWQEKDFEDMYQTLFKNSRKEIPKTEFVERFENIYSGIEVENLQVDAMVEGDSKGEQEGDTVTFQYEVKMDTMAGPLEFTHHATLVKEKSDSEQRWFMNWEPSLIFPSLENGDEVAVETIRATRGEIRDNNGSGLAINDQANVIGVVPSKLGDEPDEAKKELANLLDMSVKAINNKLNASWVQPDLFVPLATLPPDENDLSSFLAIPGVKAQEKVVRTYPFGESAAHLTGYVREITAEQLTQLEDEGYSSGDIVGNTGLEHIFEDKLRGKDGGHLYIKNPDGSFKETLIKTEPVPGEDIHLTIDAELQHEIYEQLKGDAGTAVALDPKSGAVLSLVNSPSYDPNAFVRGLTDEQWNEWSENPQKPFLNRFTNRYAPGSVFKTITAAVGLKTGVTGPNEVRHIQGLQWTKDKSWGDYYVTRVYEKNSVNLRNAFVFSDNIYFAQEALEMGIDTFTKETETFGFGEELSIPFSIEPSILSNEGIKSEVQLADTSYGQGEVMMSPLHLALTYTPFLNEGDLLHPYLLKTGERTIWKKNIIAPTIADLIKKNLIQVVDDPDGTGHGAFISGMTIAGKSGTAEIKASKDDNTGTENGWFVGFDTEDPELLLTIMIEDVKQRGGSGYVITKARNIFQLLQ